MHPPHRAMRSPPTESAPPTNDVARLSDDAPIVNARPENPAPAGRTGASPWWRLASVAALVCVGLSGTLMARKVAAFNREHPPAVFYFMPVNLTEFTYADRPVTLTDEGKPAEPDPAAMWFLNVRYGSDELKLRATVPGDPRLPGLVPHMDWLRLLRFAEGKGMSLQALRDKVERGEVQDRLVLVTRTPEPGADPETFGRSNKRAWLFDFYTFRPEGGFDRQRLRFPHTSTRSKPKPSAIPMLEENTWQYQAAMLVMPPGSITTQKFERDALGAMGWTLPATSLSFVALLLTLVFGARPAAARRAGPAAV